MKRVLPACVAVLVLAIVAAGPAFAVDPGEMLKNPVLEKRARVISAQLRCLVCQNESIDVSNADLAKDIRLLVRRRLKEGETNKQVIDYVVSRYGEFVLLKPRFETKTLLLWGTPVIVLLCGAAVIAVQARRRNAPAAAPLSEEEEANLTRALSDGAEDRT